MLCQRGLATKLLHCSTPKCEAAEPHASPTGPNDGNLNAITPTLAPPQSLPMIETTNERHIPIENIAESSFTEPAAGMEYRIRLVENIELLTHANRKIKSYVAVKADGQETPCLIHVYKSENEEIWRNTTTVLSFLSSNGGHDNILPFLWSAKGDKVRVENIESLKTIKLEVENDDCLICYELPSKQTLDVFLKLNNQEIAEKKAYYILNGLIRAIHYLSSKKVVLRSVLPENIILVESPQLGVVTTVLGGLHEAKFVSSSSEEGNELSEENLKELEVNVMTFGNMTKMLLAVCPALDKYQELVDIMVSCLSDCKPTASDLVEQLALMDR